MGCDLFETSFLVQPSALLDSPKQLFILPLTFPVRLFTSPRLGVDAFLIGCLRCADEPNYEQIQELLDEPVLSIGPGPA